MLICRVCFFFCCHLKKLRIRYTAPLPKTTHSRTSAARIIYMLFARDNDIAEAWSENFGKWKACSGRQEKYLRIFDAYTNMYQANCTPIEHFEIPLAGEGVTDIHIVASTHNYLIHLSWLLYIYIYIHSHCMLASHITIAGFSSLHTQNR